MNRISLGLVAGAAFGLALGGIGIATAGDGPSDDDRPTMNATQSVSVDEEQAREIALQTVGGGRVEEVEFEVEDEGPQWKIDVIFDGVEYDVRVDANTGDVVRFRTHDGRDDDGCDDDRHDDKGHDDDHDSWDDDSDDHDDWDDD